MDLNVQRLGKHKDLVSTTLDAAKFDVWLSELVKRQKASPLTKLTKATMTFLQPLEQFTKAINSMSNADPIACLVWGSVQAVLILANVWTDVLESITKMIMDLTHSLPLFENWRVLFARTDNLEEPLRELYNEYVNFCINIVLLFKSTKWSVLSRLERTRKVVWGNTTKEFSSAERNIQILRNRFQERAAFAHASASVATNENMNKLARFSQPLETIRIGIPFERLGRFQGREKVLVDLHNCLLPRGADAKPGQYSCTVHGMGGMGKTSTALEYTYRFGKDYNYIFWVNAQTEPGLSSSFSLIARNVMPEEAGQDQKLNTELVRNWLGKYGKWLIVFDNVEDVSLREYWPATSHGSIIVTTQRVDAVQRATSDIALTPFEEEDGSELILRLSKKGSQLADDETKRLAKAVSNEVGGLPLLISHVSGFLGVPDDPKVVLRDIHSDLQVPSNLKMIYAFDSTTSTNFQYDLPMSRVWKKALDALTSEASVTIQVLSMLGSEGIHKNVLRGDWTDPELDFLKPARSFDFTLVQKSLVDRHLVEVSFSHSTISIHRQLKQFILSLIEESGETHLRLVFSRALEMVRRAFPLGSAIQGPTNHTWKECENALPHVLSLRTIYETRNTKLEPSRDLATLLADAANYLWERGLMKDSQKLLRAGENVCDTFPGDPEIAPINANLCAISGAVHAEIGFSGRHLAMEKCKKALELRKQRMHYLEEHGRVNKEDGMLLSNGYNDLGVVSIQAEDWDAANLALIEALKLKQRFSTEANNPVQFGENYKNQAFVALAQGNVDEARHLAERGHELYASEIPEKSAAVQKTKFIFACILLNTGNFERAKKMNKEVLKVRVELFGEKHHLVKDSRYMMGEIYRLLGKYPKAEKFFRASLMDSEAASFPEESIARSRFHLALAIREQKTNFTTEREKECMDLEAEAKKTRDNANHIISDHRKAEGPESVHDFMVSLWSGRTVGMFKSWQVNRKP
ncbi:MAG: hypothetical protein Q9176_007483 [Flavoplaca citrina]